MPLRGSPAPLPARGRLVLAALALLLPACGAGDGPAGAARGVLLVSVDSLRADHMSCYGYRSRTAPEVPTTPILDRLVAAKGARYTRAYSTTSWTLPSHMALMTGLPNELHGVRGLPDQLHPSRPYLAELLRDAGWRTGGFWSGPNLHPYFGFDRGFELYQDCSTVVVEDEALFDPTTEETFEATVDMHEASHEGVTGPALVEGFRDWFATVGDDERFFALVHMWDVHYDYEAPPEHDLFYPGYRGPIDGKGFTDLELKSPATPKGRQDLDRLIALYDAEIRFTDHNVGLLLDELRRRGREDDTLVVFVSDHGEEFLEHEALGHKHSLFEECVLVPLLMRLPGVIPERLVVDEMVGLVDLAPTILELAGVPIPGSMWGTSLVPTFDGGAMPERILPLELSFKPAPQIWRATIDGRWKVNDVPGEEALYKNKLLLFDVVEDPGETEAHFVLRKEPNEPAARAQAFWEELDRQAAALPFVDRPDVVPNELIESLGAMGYVGDDEDLNAETGDADE